MGSFNDIGIDKKLDWNRIEHLMKIGIFAAFMVLIGDMLLGWGVTDPNLSGMDLLFSKYSELTNNRIFWSSLLGFIGIPLEGLCYFAVYRLIVPYSEKYAHMYRSGILGYLAFAGCGVHVPCVSLIYFYRCMTKENPGTSLNDTIRYGAYFLLPGLLVFLVFLTIQTVAHIAAFSKGLTPYPKWCWIFCVPVGMVLSILLKLVNMYKEYAIINALTTGWISFGHIWMFGGLLLLMNKAKNKSSKV